MPFSSDAKVRLAITIPGTAAVGSTIPVAMRLENASAQPVELYLRGREITFDFLVADARGEIVWRRLEGEIILAILRLEVLVPGQAIEFGDTWDQRDNFGQPVAPGDYSVRGEVLTDGSSTLESASVTFRIDPK